MKKKILFTISIVTVAGIFFSEMELPDSNGMNRHSGSSNEYTCSESGCYGAGDGNSTTGGLPDNEGPGSISSNLFG